MFKKNYTPSYKSYSYPKTSQFSTRDVRETAETAIIVGRAIETVIDVVVKINQTRAKKK